MSTKVYNGFRVRGATSLDSAFRIINTKETRESLRRLIETLTLRCAAKLSQRTYDRMVLGLSDDKPTTLYRAIWNAHDDIAKRQQASKDSNRRDPGVDFALEISLIPCGRQVLGLSFPGSSKIAEWLLTRPFHEDYSFWDNSDRPEEVTGPEWNARSRTWGRVFRDSSIPAELGVTLQLNPPMFSFAIAQSRSAYIPHFDSVEKRAETYAIETIRDMQMKKLSPDYPDKKDFWNLFRLSGEFTKTPEGQEMVTRLAEDYLVRLPDLTTAE